MKKYLLIFAFLFGAGMLSAYAEDLRLHIRNDIGEELPYAYIYVNGNAVAVTDSTGTATIAAGQLNEGDTIKAVCVGTEPEWVVYNAKLQKRGEYQFKLKEIFAVFKAEAVTVTATADAEKLFRQHFKKLPSLNYNAQLTADLSMSIHGKQNVQVAGKLEADNRISPPNPDPYRPDSPYTPFNSHFRIITASGTVSADTLIHPQLHVGLECMNNVINYIAQGQLGPYKPNYRYLGMDDNCRVFRITYPNLAPGVGLSYQILAKIDENTGRIRRVEFNIFNKAFQGELQINADFEEYQNRKPNLNKILVPTHISYYSDYAQNQRRVRFNLTNIKVVYHRWK